MVPADGADDLGNGHEDAGEIGCDLWGAGDTGHDAKNQDEGDRRLDDDGSGVGHGSFVYLAWLARQNRNMNGASTHEHERRSHS